MKIAFYHELHKGGARRGTNEFAIQLKNKGYKVDLYTIEYLKEEKRFYSNIYSFKFTPKIWKGNDWKVRLYKDTLELNNLRRLNKQIASVINLNGYDACYVAASFFLETPFIFKYLKIPSFFYCNDPYYRIIYENDLFNRSGLPFYKIWYEELVNRNFRKYLDKKNINKINNIISISNFVSDEFYKVYKKKGTTVYYGVNLHFFSPKQIKKTIDILFIGSRDFLDGFPLFEETLKYIKHKVKIRTVLFEDEWLSDKELLETYRKSKILVATAFREPLGLVPLEAMSCGVPVIAVDEGGHKETVINNKTGFLVNKNPKEIANKIDLLLSNKKLYEEMSTEARDNIVKNWSWEKRGRELDMLLIKTLKENKK